MRLRFQVCSVHPFKELLPFNVSAVAHQPFMVALGTKHSATFKAWVRIHSTARMHSDTPELSTNIL